MDGLFLMAEPQGHPVGGVEDRTQETYGGATPPDIAHVGLDVEMLSPAEVEDLPPIILII